ncbi:MAG TPA: hypothetical protein VLA04_00975 [Verrucomicrobiae bacterium]|nr:hypothetical protein [Verrucomicrobiae bacterium]
MRDNKWLAEQLDHIHSTYFADVPIENTILVRFGRESRTRFGSIIAKPTAGYRLPVTYITINSLFKDETVPEYVIQGTLLHEFAHYAHGFHSPLKQKYRYPHKGGIVNREIRTRGAGDILKLQTRWIKDVYRDFLKSKDLL